MAIFNRKKGKRARDKPGNSAEIWPVSKTRADMSMIGVEAVYAAVNRIATTMAMLPMHLYKDYKIVTDDPLERLVSYAPAPGLTGYKFRMAMAANMGNEGTAYALIVPSPLGGVQRLDVLDPTRVTPYRDVNTQEIWYKITPDAGADQFWAHESRMLVLPFVSANGYRGVRPLDVLRGTLDYDKAIKEFSVDQLEGVSNGVILEVPNVLLSGQSTEKLVQDFVSRYEKSRGHVLALEGGMKVTPMSRSPVDARVLDVERVTRNRVATVFCMPPHLLGDYSDTSFSTAEQQMQEYMQLTILPLCLEWEEEFNRKLLTYERVSAGERFGIDLSAMLRADTTAQAEATQKAVRGGWMLVDEARAIYGRAPLPNGAGEKPLISRDMIPLDAALTEKTRTTV